MQNLTDRLKKAAGKIWKNIWTLLIGLLSLGLVLSVIWPDFSFSQTENRSLAGFPSISAKTLWNGEAGKSFESYAQDQFPGRDLFFHLNYIIRKLSGQSKIQDVYLGHGALYSAPDNLSQEILDENRQALDNLAASSDFPVSVMVCPGAASVQKERLPYQAFFTDEVQKVNEMNSQLALAKPVSLTDLLSQQKDQYIFYKTDHHWTSDLAGQAAGLYMNQAHPEDGYSIDQFENMPVSDSFMGTLASASGSCFLKDTICIRPWISQKDNPYVVTWADGSKTTSIYNTKALSQKDQYQVFLGANQSVVSIDTMADNDRNLLILKDSYANSMIQFLLPYYRSITIVDPRYCMDDLSKIINRYGINEILAVYSCETLMSDTSLKTMLAEFASQAAEGQNDQNAQEENSEDSGQGSSSESSEDQESSQEDGTEEQNQSEDQNNEPDQAADPGSDHNAEGGDNPSADQ